MKKPRIIRERKGDRSEPLGPDGNPVGAPSIGLMAMEMRASWEWGAGVMSLSLMKNVPRGDGHPVLVFPGLGGGDLSTLVLRRFLKRNGFSPHPWNFGVNFGPRFGVLGGCLAHLKELHEWYGKKVSLVGWSLGGCYARELAKLAPDYVRTVISMGSPFTGSPKANHAWRFFEMVCEQRVDDPELYNPMADAPPVPTTSIYSRTDGIVSWQCCVEKPGPLTENIEVFASHFGLGVNPSALYAVADRLAQPEGHWKPFERKGIRKLVFGDPLRHGCFV